MWNIQLHYNLPEFCIIKNNCIPLSPGGQDWSTAILSALCSKSAKGWLAMWQMATAAAQGQWTAEWFKEVMLYCWDLTIHGGTPCATVGPQLPELILSPLQLPRFRPLPPLLHLPFQRSHSFPGAADEYWSAPLQRSLPKTETHCSLWQIS